MHPSHGSCQPNHEENKLHTGGVASWKFTHSFGLHKQSIGSLYFDIIAWELAEIRVCVSYVQITNDVVSWCILQYITIVLALCLYVKVSRDCVLSKGLPKVAVKKSDLGLRRMHPGFFWRPSSSWAWRLRPGECEFRKRQGILRQTRQQGQSGHTDGLDGYFSCAGHVWVIDQMLFVCLCAGRVRVIFMCGSCAGHLSDENLNVWVVCG